MNSTPAPIMRKLLDKSVVLFTLRKVVSVLPQSYRLRAIGTVILMVVNAFLELFGLAAVIPIISVVLQENAIESSKYLSMAYNGLGFQSENSFIFFLCGTLLFIIVVRSVISIWIYHKQARFSYDLFEHYATRLHRYFYSKGLSYFKKRNSNKIVRDINIVSDHFAKSLVVPLIALLTEFTLMLTIAVSLLVFQPAISLLLAVILLPVSLIFFKVVKRRIQLYKESIHELQAETGKDLFQSIFGYVDVEINNRSERFFDNYQNNVNRIKKMRAFLLTLNQVPQKVLELGMMVGIVAIVIFGVVLLDDKSELTITLGILALAAYRVLPSFNRTMLHLMNLRGYQYVIPVIEKVTTFEEHEITQTSIEFNESLTIDNLSFSYGSDESDKVLDGISFEVKKGDRIGIIGRSGSGKTTLVNILLRFLNESGGSIKVDGVGLGPEHIRSWRKLVGYVQQEVYLLDATLAENIAFGQETIDDERVMEVVRLASLLPLVNSLPQGIHTRVGERGGQISGGQRQRIGIARALYEGAEILFFDEATSALDNETEQEITESIHHLAEHSYTMFIIAHRFTTLKYCNKIFELDSGRIVKELEYEELVNAM